MRRRQIAELEEQIREDEQQIAEAQRRIQDASWPEPYQWTEDQDADG
jgi:hypothetical protein